MNRNYLAVSFSVAAAWFAMHCGGGFATGNQELNFYAKYGYTAFFLPFIAMIFVAWTLRNSLVIAKDSNTHDYRSFVNVLYHPYEKLGSYIFELCMLATILIAVSTSIAGAGALLRSAVGVPYYLGITGVGAVVLLLTIFGSDLVLRVLNYKTYFLIVTLVTVCFLGLRGGVDRFSEIWATKEAFGTSFGEAVLKACLYVGFQAFTIAPLVSISQRITTTKECNFFGFFGVFVNGVFLTVVCIMIAGFTPGILKETLPVYYVTVHIGFPWLRVLYSIILFVALLGTSLGFVFTAVARFENAWKGSGIFENLRARRIAVAVVTIILCVGASTFGLTALVVKGYGSLGYVGLLFVVLPLLTVGTIKIRRAAEARAQ